MINNLDKIKEITGMNSKLWETVRQMNIFPISKEFQNIIDTQNRINSIISKIEMPKSLIPNFSKIKSEV